LADKFNDHLALLMSVTQTFDDHLAPLLPVEMNLMTIWPCLCCLTNRDRKKLGQLSELLRVGVFLPTFDQL
jgi:hypothetical protein